MARSRTMSTPYTATAPPMAMRVATALPDQLSTRSVPPSGTTDSTRLSRP